MSATSSRFTTPSLSRSKIWNPSLNSLTCAGCSFDKASPPPVFLLAAIIVLLPVSRLEALVGDFSGSLSVGESLGAGGRPLGVHCSDSFTGDCARFILDGVPIVLVGDGASCLVGVVELRRGDGEAGDSGRRNGEDRGELKESGDGLYDAGIDWEGVSMCH
jgi:hypothetical protein